MKIELSHDILAQKVYDKVSAEDKNLRKVERVIAERYEFYEGNHRKLTRAEINYIQPYISQVSVEPEEKAFIEDGIRYHQRRLIIVGIILALLFIGLLIASSTFYSLWSNAEFLKDQADSAKNAAIEQRMIAERQTDEAVKQKKYAEDQKLNAERQKKNAEEQRMRAELAANLAYRKEEEAKIAAKEAEEARDKAETAEKVARDAQANEASLREAAEILRLEATQKARAVNLLKAQSLATQSLAIENDNDLRYVLARDAYRIHECYRQDSINGKLEQWGNPNDATIYNAVYQSYRALKDEPKAFEYFDASRGVVRGIIFDGNYFYSAGSDGRLYRTPYQEDSKTHVLNVKPTFAIPNADWKLGRILQLIASPNKHLLALAGEGNRVIIYDKKGSSASVFTYREASKIQDTVRAAVFLDDQHLLLAHSRSSEVKIINTALDSFSSQDLAVKSNLLNLAYDPIKNHLAGSDHDGNLYIWQVNNQGGTFTFSKISVAPEKAFFTALAFRPGENQLAAGSREGTVYLFSPNEGRFERTDNLWGHKGNVSALIFAAKSDQLASASFDGTIRVWDFNGRKYPKFGAKILAENYPLTSGNNPWAFSLAFSPDGHYLLCGYKNGTIKTWPLLASDLFAWTEKMKSQDPLSEAYQQEVWERYVGDGEDNDRDKLLQCN
ncbi:MAG: hypothetical protein AAF927_23305 [Bacteroidota bacterium]